MNPIQMPDLQEGLSKAGYVNLVGKTKVVIEAKLGNETYTVEIKVSGDRSEATKFISTDECQEKIQKLVLELHALRSIYIPSTLTLQSQGDKKTLFKKFSKTPHFEGGLVEKTQKWQKRQAENEANLKELEEIKVPKNLNSLSDKKKSELSFKYRINLTVEDIEKKIKELQDKRDKRSKKIDDTSNIVQYLLSRFNNPNSTAVYTVKHGSPDTNLEEDPDEQGHSLSNSTSQPTAPVVKDLDQDQDIDEAATTPLPAEQKDLAKEVKHIFREKFSTLVQIPYHLMKGTEKIIYSIAEKFGLYKNKRQEEETGSIEMTKKEEKTASTAMTEKEDTGPAKMAEKEEQKDVQEID